MNRILDTLIAKGHVVKNEDLFDRRHPIVTYSRVEVMDLSPAGFQSRRASADAQKVYDSGTGQFLKAKKSPDLGKLPCLNVEGMREVAEMRRQQSESGEFAEQPKGEAPLTSCAAPTDDAPQARANDSSASPVGRDTSINKENAGNLPTGGDAKPADRASA
jgi:hypothetical protein